MTDKISSRGATDGEVNAQYLRDMAESRLSGQAELRQMLLIAADEIDRLRSPVSETGEPDAYLVEYRETLINGSKKRCTQASLEPREPTIFRNEEPEVEARELLKVTPLYASRSASATHPVVEGDLSTQRAIAEKRAHACPFCKQVSYASAPEQR